MEQRNWELGDDLRLKEEGIIMTDYTYNTTEKSINLPKTQELRYKTFLQSSPPMGKELARKAATVYEPCYCIVSRGGRLERQTMQCNDIAVLFKYPRKDGYNVKIFPASSDFKLSKEDWAEAKEIINGLR